MGSVHKVLINSYSLNDIPLFFSSPSKDCKHFTSTNKELWVGCILIHLVLELALQFMQLITAKQERIFSFTVTRPAYLSAFFPPKVLLISKLHKIEDLSETL
jgi:hypothetical protein